MLSAVIRRKCSYPAMPLTGTTGTLGISPLWSSRHIIFCYQKCRLYLHPPWAELAVLWIHRIGGPSSFQILNLEIQSLRGLIHFHANVGVYMKQYIFYVYSNNSAVRLNQTARILVKTQIHDTSSFAVF